MNIKNKNKILFSIGFGHYYECMYDHLALEDYVIECGKKMTESATPYLTATQKNLIHLASICFLENTLFNGSFPMDLFCLFLEPLQGKMQGV
jgi:hypothetical protein